MTDASNSSHTLGTWGLLRCARGKASVLHTRAVFSVCTVYVSFFLTLTTPTDGSRHSPETLTATPLARTRRVPAPAGGARSPSRPPHGSGPVSVIVAHMSPVPDAFPARALPRSGSNRCVLRQPSTWRVASGSILAISMRSRSSPRRARTAKPRVGLEALLASLCVRLRAVRRHGEPRQQHLLA